MLLLSFQSITVKNLTWHSTTAHPFQVSLIQNAGVLVRNQMRLQLRLICLVTRLLHGLAEQRIDLTQRSLRCLLDFMGIVSIIELANELILALE